MFTYKRMNKLKEKIAKGPEWIDQMHIASIIDQNPAEK